MALCTVPVIRSGLMRGKFGMRLPMISGENRWRLYVFIPDKAGLSADSTNFRQFTWQYQSDTLIST